MPISLRPYQIEAADAVAQCHADGTLRPAVILPTGTGKTTVIAELARRQTNTRSVTLAHRTEIVDQIADRLEADSEGERASAVELALEGLFLARRIGKEADETGQTIYG